MLTSEQMLGLMYAAKLAIQAALKVERGEIRTFVGPVRFGLERFRGELAGMEENGEFGGAGSVSDNQP